MSSLELVDGKYYQSAAPRSLGERLTIAARDRIYADFLGWCRPSRDDRILDVGVSDVINNAANVLERKHPYQDRITAIGLGEGRDFRRAYPLASYIRVEANQPLPFPDGSFDIATCNAVLEHVGGEAHQRQFIREMLRVALKVFVSVPNRYFPVEHHTAIPLLHFSDRLFAFACIWSDRAEWADEKNLVLMSRQRLARLCPPEVEPVIGFTGLSLGRFSSNLFLFARSAGRPR